MTEYRSAFEKLLFEARAAGVRILRFEVDLYAYCKERDQQTAQSWHCIAGCREGAPGDVTCATGVSGEQALSKVVAELQCLNEKDPPE